MCVEVCKPSCVDAPYVNRHALFILKVCPAMKLVRQFVYSPFFTMRYHPNAMTTKISAITA